MKCQRRDCAGAHTPAVPCRVPLPHLVGSVYLQRLAAYVIVRHPYAFTLAWDGASAVYVKMNPEFLGWTHGLCGNNNADPLDDLVTSYGEQKLVWSLGGPGVGKAWAGPGRVGQLRQAPGSRCECAWTQM